jgi:hypothetical protein
MRNRYELVIAAATLLAHAGCAHGPSAAPAPTAAPVAAPPTGKEPPAVATTPPALPNPPPADGMATHDAGRAQQAIEVLDPGHEPRRVLWYDIAPGTTDTLEVFTDVPKHGGPRHYVTIAMTVLAVADGWTTWSASLLSAYAEARPTDTESAERATARLAPMVGATLVGANDIYGQRFLYDLTTTRQGDAVMAQAGTRFHWLMPFPSTPVGVGARWAMPEGDVGWQGRTTFTLKAIDGNVVTLLMHYDFFDPATGAQITGSRGDFECVVDLHHVSATGTGRVYSRGELVFDTAITRK